MIIIFLVLYIFKSVHKQLNKIGMNIVDNEYNITINSSNNIYSPALVYINKSISGNDNRFHEINKEINSNELLLFKKYMEKNIERKKILLLLTNSKRSSIEKINIIENSYLFDNTKYGFDIFAGGLLKDWE